MSLKEKFMAILKYLEPGPGRWVGSGGSRWVVPRKADEPIKKEAEKPQDLKL